MADDVDSLIENLRQIRRTQGQESYKRAWNHLTREQQKLVEAKIKDSLPAPNLRTGSGERFDSNRASREPRLLQGEQILGSISTNKTTFYATTSRVLRHLRTFLTEKLDDVSYPHISSTSLEHGPNANLLTLGVAILILGILPLMFGFLFASDLVLWGFFLMVIGVLIMVIAFLYATSFWQIRVVGLSARELRNWQLRGGNREQTEEFARLIQDQIRPRTVVEREREVSRESLVQREIVKVRCRNCGRLNLETNQSCENCGAKM